MTLEYCFCKVCILCGCGTWLRHHDETFTVTREQDIAHESAHRKRNDGYVWPQFPENVTYREVLDA